MIVIVTGGRNYAGSGLVAELDRIHAETSIAWLLAGDAAGADEIAYRWARAAEGVEIARFAADWVRLGTSAGPLPEAGDIKNPRRRGPKTKAEAMLNGALEQSEAMEATA